ncbi:sulfurtransferase complex subunit TusD [Actinobacillus pleuropneumoniae]|uniref:Sulfurtransferase complex subunit TusD n=1 Tax=Actinobacillus pleuropneumoniae TaxID=715 RepID=A0ABM6X4G4_ACTPL|nr:sulfurtransferase complex subunit TusD [Actinobacillus pleuropneumoniae]ASU15491.1 Sulfurtransferase TusD [Actinobacillus pleuropneumoniae]AWG96064.1 sulfurtransferase complex subunit TusD [Actinobacillus pleuropneumoniae serovar 1 str. 4074]AXA22134.1 sulfurtransferase complex subunit TusD [Actinobacillus pleuropneumoniae]EFM93581.1 Sulfurtransferase tusD [Actinobacillus pleuropneumoniae serovar 9 str. CVJ13261]EFM97905.1 Sulfurtransferase tusD [Actinobacillus pleuropneumoniae serovar 11 s
MDYVLAVKSPVYGDQGAYLAYQVAESLLASEHNIKQVFFFQDGVGNANALVNPASDEINLVEKWQELAKLHDLPLHLCISAAQRRGVVDNQTSKIQQSNLADGFILTGLGEFSQAVLKADRLLTF